MREAFPEGGLEGREPLFSFIDTLKSPLAPVSQASPVEGKAPLRIGFEASNQYYYTPHDLVEKVINCRWVASRLTPPVTPRPVIPRL